MSLRLWGLTLLLVAATPALSWAQGGGSFPRFGNDPNNPYNRNDYGRGYRADDTDRDAAANRDDESTYNQSQTPADPPPVYEYPQRHMFDQPIFVGADQLRVHRGYWQPGGYQVRDGSPFFHSVPGAPARGPIAGGGGDSANGGNYPPPGSGYQGMGMPTPGGWGDGGMTSGYGAASMPYAVNGMSGLDGMYGGMSGFGGGAGGAGGDPYNYHFGPGYYRSGEYGHFRFPYYSYRRPWYHPGFAGFNRDVNLPW